MPVGCFGPSFPPWCNRSGGFFPTENIAKPEDFEVGARMLSPIFVHFGGAVPLHPPSHWTILQKNFNRLPRVPFSSFSLGKPWFFRGSTPPKIMTNTPRDHWKSVCQHAVCNVLQFDRVLGFLAENTANPGVFDAWTSCYGSPRSFFGHLRKSAGDYFHRFSAGRPECCWKTLTAGSFVFSSYF